MRSRKISFRLTWRLYDNLETLIKKRGIKNLSRLMFALCSMAVLDDRRMLWVADMANADPSDQDYAIDHMLDWPRDFREILKVMKRLDQVPKK